MIPILTERTVVRKLNEKRINKIIAEASEQSNRLNIPKLDKIIKLENFLKSNQNINIVFGDLNSKRTKLNLEKIAGNYHKTSKVSNTFGLLFFLLMAKMSKASSIRRAKSLSISIRLFRPPSKPFPRVKTPAAYVSERSFWR